MLCLGKEVGVGYLDISSLHFYSSFRGMNLLLAVPLLDSFTATHGAVFKFGLWRNWLGVIGCHPTCMSQAIRRDQVFPSSNKGGCFISHPLFAMYKPDAFGLTAHLRPLPSLRLSELDVYLSQSQSSNDSSGAATPFGGKNLGAFSLNIFCINKFPNFGKGMLHKTSS